MSSANYTEPVKFSSTGNYSCVEDDEDDVYTVKEFCEYCRSGCFTDYDGMGSPVKEGLRDRSSSMWIYPSNLAAIPEDATHIVWYNR